MRRRDFVTAVAAGAVGAGAGAGAATLARYGEWPEDARMTFAQQGEDIVLFHVIRDLLRVDRDTYVDVGAAEPVRSSNTYLPAPAPGEADAAPVDGELHSNPGAAYESRPPGRQRSGH